jgi:hypothetical protein
MRYAILNGLVIGMSLALLWAFTNIWIKGQILVGESNIIIRILETAILLLICVFGIANYVYMLKHTRRSRE